LRKKLLASRHVVQVDFQMNRIFFIRNAPRLYAYSIFAFDADPPLAGPLP
jgi:hypothetical protein